MAQDRTLKLLYDKTRHVIRELGDGRWFIVTATEDQLLRDGLRGTPSSVRWRQWRDLLDRQYKNVFNQNVSQMSEVLDELYPSGDYSRDSLYRNIPTLRQKTEGLNPSDRRNLRRIAGRLTQQEREYMRRILAKDETVSPFDRGVGEKATEKIFRGKKGSSSRALSKVT